MAQRRFWSTKEVKYLREHAGLVSVDHMAKKLKRSTKSVRRKAEKLGISTRYYNSKMQWCPRCAQLRSTVSPITGICRVCAKREQYELGEQRVSRALKQLTPSKRAEYRRQESRRGSSVPPKPIKREVNPKYRYSYAVNEARFAREMEAWEIKYYDLRINANKKRLQRIREKLGTNPRKNFSN